VEAATVIGKEPGDYNLFWNSGGTMPAAGDGAIKIKNNTIVGIGSSFGYSKGADYISGSIDMTGNFFVTQAEFAAKGYDVTACMGHRVTIDSHNGGYTDGIGQFWFDFARTQSSSALYPVNFAGVDALTATEVEVADMADFNALITDNTYGDIFKVYSDSAKTTLLTDVSAVPAGTYYVDVCSPDGSVVGNTITVTVNGEFILGVNIAALAPTTNADATVKLAWRGLVSTKGSITIDVDAGFADSTRRVGIIYASTNKATHIDAIKAAIVSAAQGGNFDADVAAYNSTSTYTKAYAMASTRQLAWSDTDQSWTYRYEFNVASGKKRAAVAYVVYEDASGVVQVAFSDLSLQTATVE